MSLLHPTAPECLVDAEGRPYFLWDMDLTLDHFRVLLDGSDPALRAYLAAKLMRQAKPDDVFSFLTRAQIRALWPDIRPHLGRTRRFWTWLLDAWEEVGNGE